MNTLLLGEYVGDSMYAKYLTERTEDSIIETSEGFATYRFLNETQCYIIDIYVLPDYRKTGAASAIADKIAEIAKERGCKELVGTVVPSTKNSTTSLKVLFGYGMHLDSATNNLIVCKKEL
jgi:GNAT superfamily N-acetyltransferase